MLSMLLVLACRNPFACGQKALIPVAESAAGVLTPAGCSQPAWAGGFGLPGVDGQVMAVAVSEGSVYVVGEFFSAGSTKVNEVAMWDGRNWSALGNGLQGFTKVRAVAATSNKVYAGGLRLVNPTDSSIMVWDANNWTSLPPSSTFDNNDVKAMITVGDDLYVAGNLYLGDGSKLHSVLKWDGTNWSAPGGGLSGFGRAVAVNGKDIYIGGSGLTVAGSLNNSIAHWDGRNWTVPGTGITGLGGQAAVNAIAVSGSDVYVGGDFTTAGGITANNIAKWDGTTWSALGSGTANGTNSEVRAIELSGGSVFAGGLFTFAGGLHALFVARWDGSTWYTLSQGGSNGVERGQFIWVNAIVAGKTGIFIGGYFGLAGGRDARNIVQWDGAGFSELGGQNLNGLDGTAYAIATVGNDVYAGGDFTTAGGLSCNGIARWDGAAWHPLGTAANNGVNGQVFSLAVSGNNLYVGGNFGLAGGVPAYGIARWDGTNWFALGNSGRGGLVWSVAVDGDKVLIGGDLYGFGQLLEHVAQWDGNNWNPLGATSTDIGGLTVYAVATLGTDVIAGGSFRTLAGVTMNEIAKWDGIKWSPLGSGVSPGPVYAMTSADGNLYVGGAFDHAGSLPVDYIARWDGANWSAVDNGPNPFISDPVFSIRLNGPDLYAGSYLGIARWDGNNWTRLGDGVPGEVRAIGFLNDRIYVGGGIGLGGQNATFGFDWYGPPPAFTPAAATFGLPGGTGTVPVIVPADCGWTAWSDSSWVMITIGSAGTGAGSVGYSVAPLAGAGPRMATITIANQPFSVYQIASPLINRAAIDGKNLVVTGINFDSGAVISINGTAQKTLHDDENPGSTLTGKKSVRNIAPGTTVLLQVRNLDGEMSPEFPFTRP